jgi:putative SOS response-associated peptidase YedK
MCGRFSFVASKEKTQKQLGIKVQGVLQPNYNITPTTMAYVVANDKPTDVQRMVWGLIPYWSAEIAVGGGNLINARAEGISAKSSFRMPIRQRRCLVLADSFYEWRVYGKQKLPYRIMLKDSAIMPLAGVWDTWERPDRQLVHSFSIITTNANSDMAEIHDRMPVILTDYEEQQLWIGNDTELSTVISLLKTLPNNSLRIYPIDTAINSVSANSPDLHKEVPAPPSLF